MYIYRDSKDGPEHLWSIPAVTKQGEGRQARSQNSFARSYVASDKDTSWKTLFEHKRLSLLLKKDNTPNFAILDHEPFQRIITEYFQRTAEGDAIISVLGEKSGFALKLRSDIQMEANRTVQLLNQEAMKTYGGMR